MSRLPTPEEDACWNPHTGGGPDPTLPERIKFTCGRVDRWGKCRITAILDGQPLHHDVLDPYSAFHRGSFAEAVFTKATGGAPDESTDLRWIGDAVVVAAGAQSDGGSLLHPVVVRMADVKPEPVAWLWLGRIAIGTVTMLAGDPGLGKSLVTLDIAARVSRGAPWPDAPHDPQPVGGVVLLSGEDDAADTIRPRLDAHDADVANVVALQGVNGSDTAGDYKRPVDLACDVEQLRAAMKEVDNCRLLIVDPVSAYMGKSDSHVNAEVRALLAPLAELAAEMRVAILCVSHLRKGEGQALHRTMGSLAFVAAARAAWVVCKDKSDPRRRLLLSVKNNLAADAGSGLAYTIESYGPNGAPVVCWSAEPVAMTADEAMAPEPKRRGPAADERDEAAEWLREALANSPRPASEVIDDADHCGFSKRTIQRAFQTIGGRREKTGFSAGWVWSLAEDATKATDEPQHKELGTLGETWHLRENPGENGDREWPARCQDAEGAKFPLPGVQSDVNGQPATLRGLCAGRLTPEDVQQLHEGERHDHRDDAIK